MRLLAVLFAVPALTAHAHADATDPPIAAAEGAHLGVGVESTLGGVAGLSVRHGLGPAAGLDVVVMASSGAAEYIPGGTFGSPTIAALAVRAIVPLRRLDRGTISGVAGVDAAMRSMEMTDTAYHWALEAGLRAEYFLADHLSLSLEVGAVIDLPPDSGRVLRPEHAGIRPQPDTTTVSLDNTALAAGAGLTFWLDDASSAGDERGDADRPWIALGASRSLAGVAGPAAVVRMTDSLELDGVLGVARFSGTAGGDGASAFALLVGIRQTLARRGPATLSIGGRAGLAHVGGAVSSTTWLLEAPARLELAVTSWLRIHAEGGLALAMEPGDDGGGEVPATDGTTRWSLGASGLAAGAGFTVGF